MKRDNRIIAHGLPVEHWRVVMHRVNPLIEHWGRFVGTFTLLDLCASCYTQGVIDGVQIAGRVKEEKEAALSYDI